jgi:negative regulator of flagellin synthesis FlgM
MADISNIKSTLQTVLSTPQNVDGGKKAPAEKSSGFTTTSDKVSLGETVSQALQDAPAVDQARVDAIKKAIEEGSYQVDSQKLAQKLIEFEGDL